MPHLPWYSGARRLVGGSLLAAVSLAGAVTFAPAPAAYAEPAAAGPPVVTEPVVTEPGYAQPAYAEPASAVAVDPVALSAHDQLAQLGAEAAWRHSTGRGVTVAVLDSGVDATHPDLAGRVLRGRDYVDGSTDGRADSVGHGTTVASLIAGRGEDTAVGLAPEATILPVRVLDDQNRYQSAATVADGVIWAVEQGADVINLSLGGERRSAALGEALAYAMANDVVVVACTGNLTADAEADSPVWYPAREPGVLGVAGLAWAEDGSPEGWPESLTGPETVLAAPAVVTGAQAGGGYRAVQGTSFSSALVAGAAALIRARWPELSAADVVNRLVATAEDLGAPGRDPVFGFGAVDPVAALIGTVPPVPTNPLDTTARHGTAGLGPAPDRVPDIAAPEPSQPAERADQVTGQPAGAAANDQTVAVPSRSGWSSGLLAAVVSGLSTGAGLATLLLLGYFGYRSRRRT